MSIPYSSFQSISVNELTNSDINPDTLANNDVLAYNSTTTSWDNVPMGTGGTATTVDVTDTNADATFYPTFTDAAGVAKTLNIDAAALTDAWSINPNTGDFNFGDSIKISGGNTFIGLEAGSVTPTGANVCIGGQAGKTSAGTAAVHIGLLAGQTTSGAYAVSVGALAGGVSQGNGAVAVGVNAGQQLQGVNSIAIGNGTTSTSQGNTAVAIGLQAGAASQGLDAVAIGDTAGNDTQGAGAIAIGNGAGAVTQGANSIAIGNSAGILSQPINQICLNSSGASFAGALASATYINTLRQVDNGSGVGNVSYNAATKELTYSGT